MFYKHKRNHSPRAKLLICILPFLFAQQTLAYETANNNPNEIEMAADLLVGRPALVATTVLGTAIWLVALPFTAAGGNVKDSADKLVVGPAKATFMRCLGCRDSGYQK